MLQDPLSWGSLLARSGLKVCLQGLCMKSFDFRGYLPGFVIRIVYSIALYLFVTIVCEFLAGTSSFLLNVKIDPLFDEPYRASSFEDFWARRWNVTVSSCLRETVYMPILAYFRQINPGKANDQPVHSLPSQIIDDANPNEGYVNDHRLGTRHSQKVKRTSVASRCPGEIEGSSSNTKQSSDKQLTRYGAKLTAMLASFFVSGVMHELAVYYLTGIFTGEMTIFFSLHGIFTAFEFFIRKKVEKIISIPRYVSVPLVVGTTFWTAEWLFFAPLVREGTDIRVINEIRRAYGQTGIH